jgi:hypothetical protein
MKTKFLLALLIACALALSLTPVFAQGAQNPDRVCVAGGSEVIRAGDVVRDVFGIACSVTVEEGAHVSRDLVVVGGAANVAGDVGRDAFVIGGSMSLKPTATIGRDVVTVGGSLDRTEGAKIGRNIVSNGRFNFGGGINPVVVSPFVGPFDGFGMIAFDLLRGIITALALAALGALVVVFFPQPTQRVMAAAQNQLGPSFGVGCLTLILLPVLLVALAITIIGIPVTVILAIVAAAAWIFGWVAIGYLAGERILEALKVREIAPVLAVIVGVFILALIGAVPCLGGLIALLIGTLGVGAVVLTRFGSRPYPFQPALVPVGPVPPAPMAPLVPVQPSAPVATPPAPAQPSAPPPMPSSSGETSTPTTGEAQN